MIRRFLIGLVLLGLVPAAVGAAPARQPDFVTPAARALVADPAFGGGGGGQGGYPAWIQQLLQGANTWTGPNTFTQAVTFSGGTVQTGAWDVQLSGLGTTPTAGGSFDNTTLSTAGVPVQMPPGLFFNGHVWNTTSVADNTQQWTLITVPTSDATPRGTFKIGVSLNGGATTYPLTINDGGALSVTSITMTGGAVFGSGSNLIWTSGDGLINTASGKLNFIDNAGTHGIGFDVTTDGTLKLRNRAQNADGNLSLGTITNYAGVATAGKGVPFIVADGRTVGATAAVPSVVTYTPTADGTFEVSGVVTVTAGNSYTFNAQATWTAEDGTAKSANFQFSSNTGAVGTSIANANGTAFPLMGLTIRAKANTAITILTFGTFTTVTYNVEGVIKQISFLFPFPLVFNRRRKRFRDACRQAALKRAA